MKNRVLSTIKKYNMLQKGDGVVIGLSGGADSVSLISVLKEIQPLYDLRLYAVHLNHGIRGDEAQRDEAFARELCEGLGVEIRIFRRDIPIEAKALGMTLEEAGRKIRYELFEQVLKETGSSKIAVAHNMNDNAETVLMRLCRGTGIRGLGGISPVRDNIIRPLIEVKRCEIEAYCGEKGLDYCTDSTNLSEDYTRNKIRLTLIPWLEENLNPSLCEGINKTSGFMRQEDSYLDSLAQAAFKECGTGDNSVSCKKLLAYDTVIRRRVIRLLFARYVKSLKDISAEHIQAVCILAEGKSGASLNLPYSLTAKKEFDALIIEKSTPKPEGYCYELELNRSVYISEINGFVGIYDKKTEIKGNLLYTNCFKYDIINNRLCLRSRKEGDKIALSGIGGSKRLKKLFNDLKISRDKRDTIPLLAMDSEILWVGGLRTNDKYKCRDGGVYFYFWRNEPDEGKH